MNSETQQCQAALNATKEMQKNSETSRVFQTQVSSLPEQLAFTKSMTKLSLETLSKQRTADTHIMRSSRYSYRGIRYIINFSTGCGLSLRKTASWLAKKTLQTGWAFFLSSSHQQHSSTVRLHDGHDIHDGTLPDCSGTRSDKAWFFTDLMPGPNTVHYAMGATADTETR